MQGVGRLRLIYGIKLLLGMLISVCMAQKLGWAAEQVISGKVEVDEWIISFLLLMVLNLMGYVINVLNDSAVEGGRQQFRERVLEKLIMDRNILMSDGERITRLNDDSDKLYGYRVKILTELAVVSLILIGLLVYMAGCCWPLTLWMTSVISIRILVVPLIQKRYEVSYETYMKLEDKITDLFKRLLKGLASVKLHDLYGAAERHVEHLQEQMYQVSVDIERIFQKKEAVDSIVRHLGYLVFCAAAGLFLMQDSISVGDAAQMVFLYGIAEGYAFQLTEAYVKQKEGQISARRLDMGSRPICKTVFPEKSNGVELKKVCFRYEKDSRLFQYSFLVGKGSSVAIVGENGSGKTTCVRLITGLMKPETGKVLIDGIEADSMTSQELGRQFSMISQKEKLFSLTVEENFRIWGISSREKMMEIMDKMGVQETLQKEAVKLSDGQQKRILLGIAILRGRPYTLLDEPDNYLDTEVFERIREALRDTTDTLIIVTHAPEWISMADQQVELKGEIGA